MCDRGYIILMCVCLYPTFYSSTLHAIFRYKIIIVKKKLYGTLNNFRNFDTIYILTNQITYHLLINYFFFNFFKLVIDYYFLNFKIITFLNYKI